MFSLVQVAYSTYLYMSIYCYGSYGLLVFYNVGPCEIEEPVAETRKMQQTPNLEIGRATKRMNIRGHRQY